jgi:hypothetical protein
MSFFLIILPVLDCLASPEVLVMSIRYKSVRSLTVKYGIEKSLSQNKTQADYSQPGNNQKIFSG